LQSPQPISPTAAQAIGYREVIAMLAGESDRPDTINRVQARTRQFAKRQATWFRGLPEVRSLPVTVDEKAESIAKQLEAAVLESSTQGDC
jgi:tRNA dimethylallyltransferase